MMILTTTCGLAACQTAQQKRVNLVRDRVEKLKPLSTWPPTWCHVEARLTAPASARYQQMFPDQANEIESSPLAFTWKATEASCEINALKPSPFSDNYKSILQDALCTLLQVHWVNSPFDELAISIDDIESASAGDKVHIRMGKSETLGLFLDTQKPVIETHTKGRGVLTAIYGNVDGQWLPVSLSQNSGKVEVDVSEISWSDQRIEGRREIQSFWISIGEGKTAKQSKVTLSGCQRM